MLTPKKIRMLQLLDKQVSSCSACILSNNGTAIPFWGKHSKYVLINESPGYYSIKNRIPFYGGVGDILKNELSRVGFKARDFLIINSVQCRSIGNPSEKQVASCKMFLRKYIKVINPEKILCLGNYAKYIFTNNVMGVLRERGKFNNYKLEGSDKEYPVLFTIHPAYCLYNREDGLPMLREDIELFKNTEFERRVNWMFSKEDFLI